MDSIHSILEKANSNPSEIDIETLTGEIVDKLQFDALEEAFIEEFFTYCIEFSSNSLISASLGSVLKSISPKRLVGFFQSGKCIQQDLKELSRETLTGFYEALFKCGKMMFDGCPFPQETSTQWTQTSTKIKANINDLIIVLCGYLYDSKVSTDHVKFAMRIIMMILDNSNSSPLFKQLSKVIQSRIISRMDEIVEFAKHKSDDSAVDSRLWSIIATVLLDICILPFSEKFIIQQSGGDKIGILDFTHKVLEANFYPNIMMKWGNQLKVDLSGRIRVGKAMLKSINPKAKIPGINGLCRQVIEWLKTASGKMQARMMEDDSFMKLLAQSIAFFPSELLKDNLDDLLNLLNDDKSEYISIVMRDIIKVVLSGDGVMKTIFVKHLLNSPNSRLFLKIGFEVLLTQIPSEDLTLSSISNKVDGIWMEVAVTLLEQFTSKIDNFRKDGRNWIDSLVWANVCDLITLVMIIIELRKPISSDNRSPYQGVIIVSPFSIKPVPKSSSIEPLPTIFIGRLNNLLDTLMIKAFEGPKVDGFKASIMLTISQFWKPESCSKASNMFKLPSEISALGEKGIKMLHSMRNVTDEDTPDATMIKSQLFRVLSIITTRFYDKEFVSKCVAALKEYKDDFGVPEIVDLMKTAYQTHQKRQQNLQNSSDLKDSIAWVLKRSQGAILINPKVLKACGSSANNGKSISNADNNDTSFTSPSQLTGCSDPIIIECSHRIQEMSSSNPQITLKIRLMNISQLNIMHTRISVFHENSIISDGELSADCTEVWRPGAEWTWMKTFQLPKIDKIDNRLEFGLILNIRDGHTNAITMNCPSYIVNLSSFLKSYPLSKSQWNFLQDSRTVIPSMTQDVCRITANPRVMISTDDALKKIAVCDVDKENSEIILSSSLFGELILFKAKVADESQMLQLSIIPTSTLSSSHIPKNLAIDDFLEDIILVIVKESLLK